MYSRKSNGSHVRGSKFYTELYRSHVLGDLGKNSFLSLGLFLLVFKGRVLKDQNHYISSCSNSVNERLPLRQTQQQMFWPPPLKTAILLHQHLICSHPSLLLSPTGTSPHVCGQQQASYLVTLSQHHPVRGKCAWICRTRGL